MKLKTFGSLPNNMVFKSFIRDFNKLLQTYHYCNGKASGKFLSLVKKNLVKNTYSC